MFNEINYYFNELSLKLTFVYNFDFKLNGIN